LMPASRGGGVLPLSVARMLRRREAIAGLRGCRPRSRVASPGLGELPRML